MLGSFAAGRSPPSALSVRFLVVSLFLSACSALLSTASSPRCYSQCSHLNSSLPHSVTVGVYLTSITELNPAANTYFASGYYWLSWDSCASINGRPLSPWRSVYIDNVAQAWTWTRTAETSCSSDQFPSPLTEVLNNQTVTADEGDDVCPRCNTPAPLRSYVSFRFSAMLATAFLYNKYPLDTQTLSLSFEDSYYNQSYLTLALDEDSTGVHQRVVIPGFVISSVTTAATVAQYRTLYGQSVSGSGAGVSEFSRLEIGVMVERKVIFFFVKVLPPLAIVLATSVMMLALDPSRLDARVGLSSSALLAEIFLASGFSSGVPDVGVMTVDDWLFNWSYLVILATLVECVVVHRWMASIDDIAMNQSLRSSTQTDLPSSASWTEQQQRTPQRRAGKGASWTMLRGEQENQKEKEREGDVEDDEPGCDDDIELSDLPFHPARQPSGPMRRSNRQLRESTGIHRETAHSGGDGADDVKGDAALLSFVSARREHARWVDRQFGYLAVSASLFGSALILTIAVYA